jgi:thiol-disulfide isomerase/thioredoxin
MDAKRWLWVPAVAVIGLAAVAAAGKRETPPPPGPRAPAIDGERWFNTGRKRLTDADLRGKVVLVEFWAFDCINCQRTVPAMKKLDSTFTRDEIVIVGVHTPELEPERDPANVKQAIAKLGLTYPITLDPDYRVWNAFHNQYWPALYVVDKRGFIRHVHIGELHQGTASWNEVLGWIDELRKEPA